MSGKKVTSGIPIRNGSRHAVEICGVALALRQVGWSVEIPSIAGIKIVLRIGVNTGKLFLP